MQTNDELRSFSTFLAQVEDGTFHAEVTDALRRLLTDLAAAPGNRVKGVISLSFDIVREGDVVEVRGEYRAKPPKMPRGKSVFWVTDRHTLSKSNPKQMTMPFREVNAPAADVKAI